MSIIYMNFKACPCCKNTLYRTAKSCVYCNCNLINPPKHFESSTTFPINNYHESSEKIQSNVEKSMKVKEGRTAVNGDLNWEYKMDEKSCINMSYLYSKTKHYIFLRRILFLVMLLSFWLAVFRGILNVINEGPLMDFGVIFPALLLIPFLIIDLYIDSRYKFYNNELKAFKFYQMLDAIKYQGYRLTYQNIETGTISFKDKNENHRSISVYRGYNSKHR